MQKQIIITICSFICFSAMAQEKAKTAFGNDFVKPWKRHKIYTVQLAEAMPPENFSFKADQETRSFGEMLLHIAGANYMFSSITAGEEFPVDRQALAAEGKSKEEIIKILGESFDYAENVVMNIDEVALKKTSPWGNPIERSTSRTYAEILHVMREHAAHHRGALTVYLRLKGVTPPGFID